ncbi:MAG: FHA domain-containing protein [Myxococcaceae bacterium]|nr:FHA domain-containing protein [Myxococcaceae bacterium]
MAFRLFIARGTHQGQSFIAVQPAVVIGREPSCDVVLSDPGVSGRHVKISERGGRFFVADLHSANGTLLNGARVWAEVELKEGDSVGIGTAVVQLTAPDAASSSGRRRAAVFTDDEATLPVGKALAREADTDQTAPAGHALVVERGVDRRDVPTQQAEAPFGVSERERETRDAPAEARPTALVPPLPAAAEAMTHIDEEALHEPLPPPVPDEPSGRGVAAAAGLVPASGVLRRKPDQASIATSVREPTQLESPEGEDRTDPSGAARIELPAPERASDRARRRREAFATLGGALRWYWGELPFKVRAAIGGVGALLLVSSLALVWRVFRPAPGVELPAEPVALTARMVPYSYGLGEGVDYPHSDFKELRFDVAAPTAAAVVVHYRARGIGSEEVAVSVNGHEAGFVPPDTVMPDRELETLLSHFVLKRNEPNVVLFDNVKNPPGKEPWRISHLWMELIPVPDFTPEQALAAARDAYTRAEVLEKQREAGDDTVYRLWRTYRTGWIALLPVEEPKRTWLFAELKRRADVARGELDVLCGTLMLDAKKQMELKNPDAAREILEGVSRYFPTQEHSCPAQAEEKLVEYDL